MWVQSTANIIIKQRGRGTRLQAPSDNPSIRGSTEEHNHHVYHVCGVTRQHLQQMMMMVNGSGGPPLLPPQSLKFIRFHYVTTWDIVVLEFPSLRVFCCVALIDFVPTDLQHQTSVTGGGLASQPSTCHGCIDDDGSSHNILHLISPQSASTATSTWWAVVVLVDGGRTVAKQHKTTDKWQEELC